MDQGRSVSRFAVRLALVLLALQLFGGACWAGSRPDRLKVGAWNLHAFGPTKAGRPEVLASMARVVRHFDLVAVQEIRDRSGQAIDALADATSAGGEPYGVIVGPRLGRSSSKEQYAFLFDPRTVEPLGRPVTVTGSAAAFHRPPLAGRFRAREGGFTFVLVVVHVDPDEAPSEIAALPRAVRELRGRFPEEDDFILVGDLNADCAYFDETGRTELRGPGYLWLIGDHLDTTVKPTDCTYDRIVITAEATGADFSGAAGVFDFREALRLAQDEAAQLSDHFPVWAEFFRNREGAARPPARADTRPRPKL